MPTGMYPRSAEYREKMMACLQLGREESARTKASIKLRALGQNKDWTPSRNAHIVAYGTVRDFGETVIAVTRPVAPGAMEHIVERR